MKRVALYIRVSTQEQKKHGFSVEAQFQKLRDYAESHGMIIIDVYKDEGISGQKAIEKRPGLMRMVQDAQAGMFDEILFIKIDRFSRSVPIFYKCMELLGDMPWTATEERFSTADANGKMLLNMKLTIAQHEAQTTGERIRFVNNYKVRSGLAIVPTRLMPFCFERKDGRVVKRNEEIMLDLIDRYETTFSVRGTMDYINNKYGMNLLYRSVSAVLRNPMICGSFHDNPNYCEPYISKERFDAIQQALSRHTRTAKTTDYIFNGLIKCPECGRILNGTQHITCVQGKKYSYSVYRCPSHRRDKTCPFGTVVFESAFERLMVDRLSQEMIGYTVSATLEPKRPVSNDAAIKKLKAELDRVNYAWEKGRLSPDEYDQKYEAITAKIAEAQQAKDRAAQAPRFATEITGDWQTLYNDFTNAEKAAFWKSTVDYVEIEWEPGKYAKKAIRDVIFL